MQTCDRPWEDIADSHIVSFKVHPLRLGITVVTPKAHLAPGPGRAVSRIPDDRRYLVKGLLTPDCF